MNEDKIRVGTSVTWLSEPGSLGLITSIDTTYGYDKYVLVSVLWDDCDGVKRYTVHNMCLMCEVVDPGEML